MDKCARAFHAKLSEWLEPEELREVDARNAENPPNTCATHDFCDANVAMAEALDAEAEEHDDAWTERFNGAWSEARAYGFSRDLPSEG